jgi:hypothetical protein
MRFLHCLGAAVLVAAARPASAQLRAQAVPVKYNLTVRPGEPVARDVSITNLGTSPVVVRVKLSDWQLGDRGEFTFAPLGTTPASLAGFVQYEPQEFSLQPGESGRIQLTMTLPKEGPATRWGVLLSEVRPALARSPRLGPRAVAKLGTTLYLSRIAADEVRAEVTDMTVAPLGYDSLSVSVRISNAGERHCYVGGEVSLTDSTGNRFAEGKFPTGVVLPGRTRDYTWTCPVTLPPGRYTALATLDTGQPELMLGETVFQWPPAAAPLAQRSPR